MLEVTDQHIAALNDTDLRVLIGRLCEAELQSRAISPAAVTYGGDQRARDGGLDVRVDVPAGKSIDGFIPRALTGFQVKATDMPAAEVRKEMSPGGAVRAVIRELAEAGGAYIIVSSRGRVSDSALRNRLDAMRSAVGESASGFKLDFYDSRRIATWVGCHPGLVIWVREKIGAAVRGWRPYGAWAFSPNGVEDEYLVDDRVRLHRKDRSGDGWDTVTAIDRLRDALRWPRHAVRLVGLSGVGKTRLVQALFDGRIGAGALDPAMALYADIGDSPDPHPASMAQDLIANRYRAIVIVDNCSAALHRRVSEQCRQPDSKISLLTIEYDVRDNEAEGAEVFELGPSSDELIEKLIVNRFPTLFAADARKLARLSGGNARVAIALAETIHEGEIASRIGEGELFSRLFQQKHSSDQSLLLAAQACSLVYSFNGRDLEGDEAELPHLAALIGIDSKAIFRHVAELTRRQLVQQRGEWRAILPHAIANRLATDALRNIPRSLIEAHIIHGQSDRLRKSFTRRMEDLHDSAEAIAIAREMLLPDGELGNPGYLDGLGMTMFINLAHICPAEALDALQRVYRSGPLPDKYAQMRYAGLVKSIAEDARYFRRCIDLLLHMASAEKMHLDATGKFRAGKYYFSTVYDLPSLFQMSFRTSASLEQRLGALRSVFKRRPDIGGVALERMLAATRHSSIFHIGAAGRSELRLRPAQDGYPPESDAEITNWFSKTLRFASEILRTDPSAKRPVRRAIAAKFQELWWLGEVHDELAEICKQISSEGFWAEGWSAIISTFRRDQEEEVEPALIERIASLVEFLRPKTLGGKVQAVLSQQYSESSYGRSEGFENTEDFAQALGIATARVGGTFSSLNADLFLNRPNRFAFGVGLALGTKNPRATWARLRTRYALTCGQERSLAVCLGYLRALNNQSPEKASMLLDDLIDDVVFGESFPSLQAVTVIDDAAIGRLERSLAIGRAAKEEYVALSKMVMCSTLSLSKLAELVRAIAATDGGLEAATGIVARYVEFGQGRVGRFCDLEILAVGRDLVKRIQFGFDERHGRAVAVVISIGLRDSSSAGLARDFALQLRRLALNQPKELLIDSSSRSLFHSSSLRSLLDVQHVAVLDALLTGSRVEVEMGIELMEKFDEDNNAPIDVVPADDLIRWANAEAHERYPLLAAAVPICRQRSKRVQWCEKALIILRRAPDFTPTFARVMDRFKSDEKAGSIGLVLLDQLKEELERSHLGDLEEAKANLTSHVAHQRREAELRRYREFES